MPTQEVPFVAEPLALLRPGRGERAVLFDGGTRASWGDGRVVYADAPTATLEVSASGDIALRAAGERRPVRGDPLDVWQRFVTEPDGECAGTATALSYDLKHWIEGLPRRLPWPAHPILYAARFSAAYTGNYCTRRACIRGTPAGISRLGQWIAKAPCSPAAVLPRFPALEPCMGGEAYLHMVRRAKEYIAAGDIYQANLAQSFRAEVSDADAAALFSRWRSGFAMPYAAFVDGAAWSLLSNSPECLLDLRGDRVSTFPIKGTRALVDGCEADALARELLRDPKECAEHVMIVDLERNDLGRVCRAGSVEVVDFQRVCSFPMLLHMVSQVNGRLREGVGLGELLRAAFPGGSITGAPKVRAMEIIEELEPVPRGFYTGAIAWTEPNGDTRCNIAIRTAIVRDDVLSFHAGGGIVSDSRPERERSESFDKSASLVRSLNEVAAVQGDRCGAGVAI